MAYKKKYRKKSKARSSKRYSASEKKSYKRGFFAGLFTAKKRRKKNVKYKKKANTYKRPKRSRSLLDEIKYYRAHNLGVLYRNGKYYDTNFIDKPHELERSFVKELHSEYDFDNKRSDRDVADMLVRPMRRKYGVYNKDGSFSHMLGEDK